MTEWWYTLKAQQLMAELREAAGQLQTAIDVLNNRREERYQPPDEIERNRWLVPHKVREAITNLEDVLQALKGGLG